MEITSSLLVLSTEAVLSDNYIYTAGVMRVPYEDVELEPHLKAASMARIVENCGLGTSHVLSMTRRRVV